MGIQVDVIVIIWFLIATLIIVGIVLFIQLTRFFRQLSYSLKKFEVTLNKSNNLIDNLSRMSGELTEISRRANVNYKQLNKVVDNIGLGISNFVMSKFDNRSLGYTNVRRRRGGNRNDKK